MSDILKCSGHFNWDDEKPKTKDFELIIGVSLIEPNPSRISP